MSNDAELPSSRGATFSRSTFEYHRFLDNKIDATNLRVTVTSYTNR